MSLLRWLREQLAPFRCRVCRTPLWIRAICPPCSAIEADVRKFYHPLANATNPAWDASPDVSLGRPLSEEQFRELMRRIYDENLDP